MKKHFNILLIFFIIFISHQNTQAQFEFQFGYKNETPTGLMGQNLVTMHGMFFGVGYKIPKLPLSFGLDIGIAFGTEDGGQKEYLFEDGTSVIGDLTLFNSFTNTNASMKLNIFNKATTVAPYVHTRVGFNFFSNSLELSDPREDFTSDCPKALESEFLSSARSFTIAVGAGTRINLIHDPEIPTIFFDFSISYVHGSTIEYVTLTPPNNIQGNASAEEILSIKFASEANPDNIQEYETGYRHLTPLDLIDIRVGFGLAF